MLPVDYASLTGTAEELEKFMIDLAADNAVRRHVVAIQAVMLRTSQYRQILLPGVCATELVRAHPALRDGRKVLADLKSLYQGAWDELEVDWFAVTGGTGDVDMLHRGRKAVSRKVCELFSTTPLHLVVSRYGLTER